jgi:hypothetical protein
MSEVLKQVEAALEIAEDRLGGVDHWSEPEVEEQMSAALTALRGLEWKPIAEMERCEEDGVWVGKWGPRGWIMDYPACSQPHAVKRGYTHFCRPILPTPPKREVE